MTELVDIFEPLPLRPTIDDRSVDAAPNEPTWRHVAPIPDDAPEPPPLRGSQRWWYHDAEGRLLFAVDRYEPWRDGDPKQFFPLTLWQKNFGELVWKRKHPPAPRPLYGLDRLAQRPNATALVSEGEKSADAAGELFPDHVAVTSPGGAQAAGKSDWSALAGRHVVIWPDNDESGHRYAEDVARLAGEAGAASVRVVEVPVQWPQGWDLADTLPDGITHETLRRILAASVDGEGSTGSTGSKTNTTAKSRQKYRSTDDRAAGFQEGSGGFQAASEALGSWLPKGFKLRADGSILHEPEPDEWQWLCSPLIVEAATRNADGDAWGRLIRIRDRDGAWHEWAMPMAELAGAGDGYRARLLGMGLELAPGSKARNALHRLLTAADPQARARCVSTLGWHGSAYMLPDEVIGTTNGEHYVLQTSAPLVHAFRCDGTLGGWQDEIGKAAVGNSRLVFSISMALAAPLLRPLGLEGGGVHWRGGSSTGKTTTGEVAGSVCGGGRHGYKVTWRATDNGIETVAAVHNDGLAVLDEIGEVSADALGSIAYMLANGQAKRRMARDGSARATAAWSLLFLSTGEIGLDDKLRESKRGAGRVMAGQQVRVLDLPADAGAGHGVFDHLAGFSNGQAFADHLKAAAAAHYGTPLRAYLRRLVVDRPFDDVNRLIADFVAEVTPLGADGQVRRAASRFAIIAAGGETARRYGIVPWPEREASNAAKRLLQEWLIARGGSEPAEIEAGLAAVRQFIERHGTSRFAPWIEPDRIVQNRAGYSRADDGGTAYYVLPEPWRSDVLGGHDAGMIAREMVRRGMLKATGDGKPQTKQRLPDGSERKVYVVLPTIFSGEERAP